MSVAKVVMETQFKKQFDLYVRDVADANFRELRQNAFDRFSSVGFPTVRQEDWKYTNVGPIAGADWSPTLPAEQPTMSSAELEVFRRFNYERNGFTALNQAFADIRVVRIPKDTSVVEPIELAFSADTGNAIFPRVLVIAGAGSKATLVETYGSASQSLTNAAIQIIVEPSANLTHYRVQKDAPDAYHYGVTEVTLHDGSRYDSVSVNLGGAISRHDIEVTFTAEGAEASVDGLYMLSGSQHHDTHSVIDHTVPNCTSHQSYKGVLNDASRGVFNGKVFVRENAHGTDAQQSNKNLLLSNDARVDTKPQLEIFNDDVKCAHGATVGQLEDEELFYLLTRGLPETLARNLLTYGFAEEIINKIGIDAIKAELDAMVLNRLGTKI